MGIDLQAIRLLTENKNIGNSLGNVLTLGRQGLSLSHKAKKVAIKNYNVDKMLLGNKWCEDLLLKHFGAKSVTSIDFSDFEGASIIHDMNVPINIKRKFDTVLDFGTSEHIFNVKTVYENIKLLCKQGGVIIHLVPANNFCGHGFYQFSPMFYKSVYAVDHGYDIKSMYLSRMSTDKDWFKVSFANINDRFVFYNNYPTTLMLTVSKISSKSRSERIQQPDYENRWLGKKSGVNLNNNHLLRKLKIFLIKIKLEKFFKFLEQIYKLFKPYHGYSSKLDSLPYVKKDIKK